MRATSQNWEVVRTPPSPATTTFASARTRWRSPIDLTPPAVQHTDGSDRKSQNTPMLVIYTLAASVRGGRSPGPVKRKTVESAGRICTQATQSSPRDRINTEMTLYAEDMVGLRLFRALVALAEHFGEGTHTPAIRISLLLKAAIG